MAYRRSEAESPSEPQTVREVRRILLLHLAEACPESCVPVHARYRQPLALLVMP